MFLVIAEQACDARSFPVSVKYVKAAKALSRALPGVAGPELDWLALRQVRPVLFVAHS